jgi:hypothetical protein
VRIRERGMTFNFNRSWPVTQSGDVVRRGVSHDDESGRRRSRAFPPVAQACQAIMAMMRPQEPVTEAKPDGRDRVGMFSQIAAESDIFTILLVAYLFYLGKSLAGPLPREVLDPPVLYTVCLLLSSVTIYAGVRDLRQGHIIRFASWWAATIALGGAFLYGTAREWRRLIFERGLTISTNFTARARRPPAIACTTGKRLSVGVLALRALSGGMSHPFSIGVCGVEDATSSSRSRFWRLDCCSGGR